MMTGACLCGAVAYEISGAITGPWLCHCSRCRRASGSAFQAGAICARESFRFTRGESGVAHYRTPSGYGRAFCATCGSPVPAFLEGAPLMWLPVGALSGDPGLLRPQHHIFVGSKAPWYEIADALPQFAEHAPGRPSA